jgi:hypothetical protein
MSIVYYRKMNEIKKISRKADWVSMLAQDTHKGSRSNPSFSAKRNPQL